jgi:hypothetical protein
MDIQALANCLVEQWEKIVNRGQDIQEVTYRIGTSFVNLKFSHKALKQKLVPAQAHLIIPTNTEQSSDLTIHVWDLASHQLEVPALVKNWLAKAAGQPQHYLGPQGEIQGGNTDKYYIAFYPGNDTFYIYDKINKLAWVMFKDANLIPYYDSGKPLRIIWHWFAQENNYVMVHAAAVSDGNKGILLVGRGGSGKSTTALVCLHHSKLSYLSDDYCLVGLTPALTIHSLYASVFLEEENKLLKVVDLSQFVINVNRKGEEKALAFVSDFALGSLQTAASLSVIGVPKIAGLTETTWQPTSSAKALLSLAPSSLLALPYPNQAKFQCMTKIVNQVPACQINLGTDISQIPNAILEILEGA